MADWEDAPSAGGGWEDAPAAPVKKQEPMRDIPVFDPGSGMATGFTQKAPIGPSKEAVEFERREGPLGYAKEYGKGAAALAAGTPAELTANLPSNLVPILGLIPRAAGYVLNKSGKISDEEYKARGKILDENLEYARQKSRVGYGIPEASKYFFGEPTSNVAAGIRTTGEVLGLPTGVSALGRLVAGPLRKGTQLERLLEGVDLARARLGKKGEATLAEREAAAAAERAGVDAKAEAERLRLRYQPVETTAVENLARSEAKVAAPDTVDIFRAGQDAESTARKLAEVKGAAAEAKQSTVGGKAFEDYKLIAEEKQAVEPFGKSQPGITLEKELDTIIGGGEGALRTYGKEERNIAKNIQTELFGKKPADFTAEEIKTAMDRIPFGTFSEPRRRQMAIETLQAKERNTARPVDWKLVDDQLRVLRQEEQKIKMEGAGTIARKRLSSAADRIEEALKGWVGEANYPREIYAEASKDKNKFQTKLGEALRAKEEIPFAGGQAQYTTPRVLGTLFESRSSTNFAKQLLGEAEVNALAERHAINQLSGKSAEEITEWMQNSNNAFIYEIPGLSEKLEKYGASVLRRQQETEALGVIRKQAGERTKEAAAVEKAAVKEIEAARTELNKGLTALQAEDPAKLASKWAEIRSRLEGTKAFKAEELDRLGEDIIKASRIADTQQRRADLTRVVGKLALKWGGIGGSTAAAGTALYKMIFGD